MSADAQGNFVVVWDSPHAYHYGTRFGIFGRRFDSSGASIGSEFQVNAYTTWTNFLPSVSCDAAGNYVVVWDSSFDSGGYGVFARRYDSSGAVLGSEFPVNSYTSGAQRRSSVSSHAAGGFVVAWNSDGQDGSGYGVFAQRFDSSGAHVGAEFQVNSYTADFQYRP
ncbi:MAG: hypothetical protein ACREQQ_10395, partial [Candidatus Binatia bacterium]